MRIAYVRVSTAEQNEQRQIDALAKHDIERWFTEKVSGKDTNRPQLQAMLEFAREGDTIYVHDFSRLARSTADLLKIVELLQRKKIHLVSNKENIDTSTPTGKLMLTMIGAINEFERQNILERQRERALPSPKHTADTRAALPSDWIPNVLKRSTPATIPGRSAKRRWPACWESPVPPWTAFWQNLQNAQTPDQRVLAPSPSTATGRIPGRSPLFLRYGISRPCMAPL